LITLDAPNQTLTVAKTSKGNGTTSLAILPTDFTWNEVVTPGHTEITLQGPANFDFCASNPASGTTCSLDNEIFGNGGTFLRVNVDAPVTITFASTPIPEPAIWSLLIGGFGALGWALRRRRSAGAQPA
jgi:hypothetical protein